MVNHNCHISDFCHHLLSKTEQLIQKLQQDYIHKVPVILRDNLQSDSHKRCGPPTSVTCLQLLCQLLSTGTSTNTTAERG